MLFEKMKKVIEESNPTELNKNVSQLINNILFNGENVIECTNIPFVFNDLIQLDYENIDMIVTVYSDDRIEFEKVNVVSETTREVKKETFIRNAKKGR